MKDLGARQDTWVHEGQAYLYFINSGFYNKIHNYSNLFNVSFQKN